MIYYNGYQVRFLKTRRRLPRAELTAVYNRKYGTSATVSQIHALCMRKGFKTGRNGYFPKGHTPWNSGTRGSGLCKPNSGSFHKGHVPANYKLVGSERIDTDGYVWVKVAEPNTWRMKHVLVWEKRRGAVPKGLILRFRDGNSLNCRLDNLELINRNYHCRLNKLHYKAAPKEYKPTLKIIAELQMRAGQLRRAA